MPQIKTATLFTQKQVTNLASKLIVESPKTKIEADPDNDIRQKLKKLTSQMRLTRNAQEVLAKRYLIKNRTGKPLEKPEDLFLRVAKYIAQADLKYKKTTKEVNNTLIDFYEVMTQLEFLPNSPTLRGAGREIHQLSACFVLPIEDTMEGIFDTLKTTSLVHKGGGGTGFSFGRLRPKGDRVGSTEGIAGGPISFMRIFDTVAREVMQGGVRVGANMGILPVNHPDILEFIDCKRSGKDINNFNLSVSVTDEFMKAVEEEKDYDLINPSTKKVVGKLAACEVFEKMVKNAWLNGDPGIIFIDKMNRDNPTPDIGQIESTNPCGEQPLLPYESCNLGSINLAYLVKDKKVNWDRLKKVTHTAVHFLDNVIEVNKFSHPKIEKLTKANRKIGLGVMGFADMLVQMDIAYNSNEALKIGEKVMKFIRDEGRAMSQNLAKERGEFPNFKGSIYDRQGMPKVRNATITTIAPTGTLSLLGNCSGGIEPFFALAYKKKSIWHQDGSSELEQLFVNEHFEKVARKKNFYSKQLMNEIIEKGSLHNLDEVPKDVKKIFVTSHDISPEWHIKIQAAIQKHTDNAVSKTINFPNSATVDDVRKSYLLSYELGCKGITIYRDGSRDLQVFTTGKKAPQEEKQAALVKIGPRKRPDVVRGFTYKTKTAYGNLYVTINEDENGEPFEVFAQMGKAGGFFAAKVEAIGRLISLALRSSIRVEDIIDELKGIRGPSPIWTEEGTILSIPDAISKVLEKHINRSQIPLDFEKNNKKLIKTSQKTTTIADMGVAPACPECGGMLEMGEGCLKCNSCGFSKCG